MLLSWLKMLGGHASDEFLRVGADGRREIERELHRGARSPGA